MNETDETFPNAATLVQWLDGELSADEAERVAAAVAHDPVRGERVRLLRAARAELTWALAQSPTAPPPAAAESTGRRRPPMLPWLLAAAGLAVVAVIATDGRADPDAAAAENDLLRLELTRSSQRVELFAGVRFTLRGEAKTDLPCRIVARNVDETDAELVARCVFENGGEPIVPMLLTAELQGPGAPLGGLEVARADHVFDQRTSEVGFDLVDVRTQTDEVGPLLTVRLAPDGPVADTQWALERDVQPVLGEPQGFVAQEPGDWRLTLRLRALPHEPRGEPAFAEPLALSTTFSVHGVVGAWSEPVDGICARLVASRRDRDGRPLAVALQLRNDSGRSRRFNVVGATMAEIPQPLHFDLLVDGERWSQDAPPALTFGAGWLFVPQPDGTRRSMVVLLEHWRSTAGLAPDRLKGRHRIAMRFHFEPTLWTGDANALWRGTIDTPPIEIDFGDG